MPALDNTNVNEEAPNLVEHYRPLGIRSVVAAHVIRPPAFKQSPVDNYGAGHSVLPEGFHSATED